ncbi:MAG TPA: cation transporter, partial [Candidatus Paceibacterota bacterium]
MIKTKTCRIKGMHCASCAGIIEKTLKKITGVESAEVNYGTETAKITFDETKIDVAKLSQKIEPFGYSIIAPSAERLTTREYMTAGQTAGETAEEMDMSADEHAGHLGLNQSKKEKLAEVRDMRAKIISATPLCLVSIFVMGWEILVRWGQVPGMSLFWQEFLHHLLPVMATYVLFVVGKPYLLGFYRFLRYGKANMDTLIGMGTTAAYL